MQQPLCLSIVMNQASGHHTADQAEIMNIAQQLEDKGFAVALFLSSEDQSLNECIQLAVQRHLHCSGADRGIIVAAGGDGTVNAVAQALLNTQIQLGILPLGTFNYVARVLEIPTELEGAVDVLVSGQQKAIHVGSVNGKIYLNNASIGMYPVIIEQREYYNKKFGRFPLVAYLSGLSTLLKPQHYYHIKMRMDGAKYPIETPMIFFGNNQLQLEEFHLSLSTCAAAGKVAGIALEKVSHWQLFRLMVKLLRGQLENEKDVHLFCAEQVDILSRRKMMKVALDGEVTTLATPLKFHVLREAIQVRVPHATSSF